METLVLKEDNIEFGHEQPRDDTEGGSRLGENYSCVHCHF